MASRFLPRVLNQTRGYAAKASVRPPIHLDGIPGKYASAAYVSAMEKGEKTLSRVETELKGINDVLKSDKPDAAKLRNFLTNPMISVENRTKTLSQITAAKGSPDAITHNLFETLSENGRLALTEKVIDDFMKLISAHNGVVEIAVTSARPLDKSAVSRLESALKTSQYATTDGAKTVKFAFKVNPALEGGFIVDVGDRSVDLTVASRVNKLNHLLKEAI
ncbi:ATP synthase F0 subcomplex subunit OSCP atp5 [Malassezia sp. CBS 17886]|nr:ATP synthase F0 subcomplex subunit OSCP atp5 [Malassezia sp. CBS 17886]